MISIIQHVFLSRRREPLLRVSHVIMNPLFKNESFWLGFCLSLCEVFVVVTVIIKNPALVGAGSYFYNQCVCM